jgi:hypothetical protein
VMGTKPGLAGWETVTVPARFSVDIRSMIGMSKLCELTETSGAANQKAVSVCAFTISGKANNSMLQKRKLILFMIPANFRK